MSRRRPLRPRVLPTGRPRRRPDAHTITIAPVRPDGGIAVRASVESMTLSVRAVGLSGLRVSSAGLGGNNFGRSGTATESLEGTRAVLDAAIECGMTFIDTADVYGAQFGLSETLIGEALRGRATRSSSRRSSGTPFSLPRRRAGGKRPARRSDAPSRVRCGGSRPTTWISTRSTARSVHADRGDRVDAGRPRAEGLVRYVGHSELLRMADRGGRCRLPRGRSCFRVEPEPVQPALPRRGACEVLPPPSTSASALPYSRSTTDC